MASYVRTVKNVLDYIGRINPTKPPKGNLYEVQELVDAITQEGVPTLLIIRNLINHGYYGIWEICSWELNKLSGILKIIEGNLATSSKTRVIKLCATITIRYYRAMKDILHKSYTLICEKLKICGGSTVSDCALVNILRLDVLTHVRLFSTNLHRLLYTEYTTSDNIPFGLNNIIMAVVENPDRLAESMEFIIPNTDITIFEFLFMDLNLTHLPILNHEELMVEKFDNLKHLIIDRCKKLNEIYNIHLVFNEVRPGFLEECTNNILKFIPKIYFKDI